jgi:phospholipase/carboxylesterase
MSYRTIETDAGVTLAPPAADASVIWLHGLGADGHDFVPIVPELRLPQSLATRFLFPHAEVRPVTLNNGFRMRAWYDIKSLSPGGRADAEGLAGSVAAIEDLITQERAAGIAAARIVIAGFSQGGAVALHAALAHGERLAGVMALSTYLPLAEELATRLAPANCDLPIVMCHGRQDPVVVPALGTAARDWLVLHRYPVEWHEYPMQHEVCAAEVADLGHWLRARLA